MTGSSLGCLSKTSGWLLFFQIVNIESKRSNESEKMTKNRWPESVINCKVLALTPPRVQFTFDRSAFYLLVFILHLAFVLPSPQSAVCIFCSVRSLYSLHKGNRLVLLFIYFSQNPTDPGIPCFPQTPSARRPCIPAPYYPLNPIWLRAVSYNLGVAQIE